MTSRFICMLSTAIFLLVLTALPSLSWADTKPAVKLMERVDYLDKLAREPMVVRHPGGALFVAGYGSQITGTDWTAPPYLWRSDTNGRSWTAVDVGTTAEGAQGNSDVDLTIGPDGTLYLVAMGFNRATKQGTHIAVGVSHDIGSKWQWHQLSSTTLDDRPWLKITPDGTAHAIWNDGSGVCHSVSRDSGATWTEQPRIHTKGGSSHLAVGPGGQLAVRISPISGSANRFDAGVDLIAISLDNGTTWSIHPAPGKLVWDPTLSTPGALPRWVEPLTWGANGTLYSLWSEGRAVKLGWSTDGAATWRERVISEEDGQAFFPYMISSATGELAATWFVNNQDSLSARLAHMVPGSSSAPGLTVRMAAPFRPSAWLENTSTPIPTPGGEYIPVIFLPNNELAVVSPIQDGHNDRWGFTWWRFR